MANVSTVIQDKIQHTMNLALPSVRDIADSVALPSVRDIAADSVAQMVYSLFKMSLYVSAPRPNTRGFNLKIISIKK